ncbi:F-box domain [Macleaya cordata]|uniref:F-box domain n=1 Tax=Macleaya cordata TaxID=56857 RepID=A0A200QAP5_MACCD|nr:F-box domain [Macleaya cordata]
MPEKMMKNCSNYDDISALIGDGIMCDILSRLPVKSLMCCKRVCKHWQYLIQQDQHLINLQLTRSKTHPFLIISIAKDNEINFFSTNDLFEGGAAVHWLRTPWSKPMLKSVNGLLCVVDMEDDSIRIFNPSTREITPSIKTTIKIDEEEEEKQGVRVQQIPKFGFGCDVYGKEYKVICVWEIHRSTAEYLPIGVERVCEVLTVGDNTWRRINGVVSPYNIQGNPVNVNGAIFWMNDGPLEWEAPDCNAVVAFDVGTEKFSLITIPNFILGEPQSLLSGRFVDLLEVDGRIALLHRRTSDGKVNLWINDGFEVTGTAATSGQNVIVYNSNWIEETISMPFDWDENLNPTFRPIAGTDKIIIKPIEFNADSPRHSVSLYYYDRKKKTSRKVEITGIYSLMNYPFRYTVNIFVESLLPVQKQQQQQHTQLPLGN